MFGNDNKKSEQAQAEIKKYGLDSLNDLPEVQAIISNLAENGALNEEAKTNSEQVKQSMLRAIMNQNWIIIKELQNLNKSK